MSARVYRLILGEGGFIPEYEYAEVLCCACAPLVSLGPPGGWCRRCGGAVVTREEEGGSRGGSRE